MSRERSIPRERFIPVNVPVISEQSKQYVKEALETGWVSSAGRFVKEFESRFAHLLGVENGIAVSSGTAAIHIALLSLGVGRGDEVIVPAFTMAGTWLPVLYTGAKPVFVDCELDTYNIDPSLIEERITEQTKAIIPVHIYGHPADMDPIMEIAERYGLFVVEDAAEVHGAKYKGRNCGSIGLINGFSFYANKIIITGEGGMVVTNNEELAQRARRFRNLGHSEERRFIHVDIGLSCRMTNLQAALGCGEIENIGSYIQQKQRMAELYGDLLKDIPGLKLPTTKSFATNVYWMYATLVDPVEFGMDRDTLRERLKAEGIGTRDFFYPPDRQPVLADYLEEGDVFPNTSFISERGLYLPSGLAITEEEIQAVASTIRNISPHGA